MNEDMERAKFMMKPFAFAKSSRQYIESLWKIGADILEFGASIALLFSSIFDALARVVIRVASFSQVIRELSLTRFMFLPPFDLWSRRLTPTEKEYFPTEMGKANVSFLFNVTVARKTVAELAKRVASKTPKHALIPRPALLPEVGLTEETLEEGVEEPARTLPYIVADLQSRFESKLAPSMKRIASALQEYSRQTVLLTPMLAMPKPFLVGPARLEGPPSHPLMAPQEKEAVQFGLPERPLTVISQVPSIPHKEAKFEPPPLVSIPVVSLRPEVARSLEYASKLPSIALEQEIPILKRMAAFSLVPPQKPPLPTTEPAYRYPRPTTEPAYRYPRPTTEPAYRYPRPTTLPPMRPSQINRLLEEISPSLNSWIYWVSEILRGTALGLSAVPVAASAAGRAITEALIQPVSSLEAPRTLGAQEPVSAGLTVSRPRMGVRGTQVEAFRLPAIVTSLIVALTQRYPLLFSEPKISETWGPSVELTRVAPEETPTPSRMPEVRTFSKLPTVIALAAAEGLIAQRLQHESSALIREMQGARSSYGERLGELGAFGPIRTTMLGKLAAAAPALLPALEPYASGIPSSLPPPTRPRPVGPTVQNTFNITISAESAEEDLRDLERKISRILSEQIRRYYGSTRV